MKRTLLSFMFMVCAVVSASAQIGYQVTVFDEAKKEPKANQAVTATVTITDNSGNVICTENVNGTTDEFGILSMQVGNATTFANTDWSKLPLWISAKVDGVTISKTQILSVPVAEHAKHTGVLTPQILSGRSFSLWGGTLSFSTTRATYTYYSEGKKVSQSFNYEINGNLVYILTNHHVCLNLFYSQNTDNLYVVDDGIIDGDY